MNFWEKKYHKKPKRSKEMEKKKGIRKVKWTIRGDGVVGRGDRWRPKDQRFSFYRIFIFHPTSPPLILSLSSHQFLWLGSFSSSSVLTITPHLRCTTSYPLKRPPVSATTVTTLSLSLCCMWSHHCIAQMRELLSSLKGISFHYCTFPSSPQLHASSLSFPSSL